MKSIIRHGSTPPTSNDLDEYQLGFCNSNNLLYIKNANGEIVPLNDLQSIRNYIDESLSNGSSNKYVDAKNSYSTTETLTGGTWIDEKPIYRKAYHFNKMLSVGRDFYTMNVGQADFDTLIKTYYIGRRPNMTDIMTAYFPTWTGENYTGFKISVNDGETMFVDYIIFEYTKKNKPNEFVNT